MRCLTLVALFELLCIPQIQEALKNLLLALFLAPRMVPKTAKRCETVIQKTISRSSSVFYHFLCNFSSNMEAPNQKIDFKTIVFTVWQRKLVFSTRCSFLIDFGLNVDPFGHCGCKMDPKIDPESDLKTIMFSNTFFDGF